MKKISVCLLLMLMVNLAFAQHSDSKINFQEMSLEKAFTLAKEKNLMVFCNFSTSWCGPCKVLSATVYSDPEVGDFMNSKFISLYIDSEAKEWVATAKEHKIKSYPTMVVFDNNGKEKFRMSGSMPKDKFMSKITKNLDDRSSPEGLKKRYESGERTPELINDYAYLKMVSGDEKTGYQIVNNYFESLPESGKTSKENWFLYTTFALNIDDLKAQYFIDNYKKYYPTIGEKEVDSLAYKFLRLGIIGYVSGYQNRNNQFNQSDFDYLVSKINETDLAQKPELLSVVNVAKARIQCETTENNNFESFIKVCKKEFDNLSKNNCGIMVSNFSNLELVGSDKAKKEAILLIQKYQSLYEKEGVKGFDLMGKAIKCLAPVKRGDAILFQDISLDEAMKQAEKKGKLIFIDCYTIWCGPCKAMAETVFTANIVKNYFDKNFINLKIDMEKGEGPAIAKKYKVKGYPTLLLIDGKGNIVHQKLGGSDVETFINEFKAENEKFQSK